MERIQNMLWDERTLDPAVVDRDEAFLLEKARREPDNGRPHELLADLENHLAREHRAKAAEYAREALTRDPSRKGAHTELVEAMGGKMADWCAANHGKLIEWYEGFVEKNPENTGGYMWLLDQLLDDDRLEEAQDYVERMAKVDGTFRTPLYRGLIALRAGDRQEADRIWKEMERTGEPEWCMWLSLGDVMVRSGRYPEAEAYYRRGFESQQPPRYVDSLEAIAQVCELRGDLDGAVKALEEKIALLSSEWDTAAGETVDQVRREIGRLKAKRN